MIKTTLSSRSHTSAHVSRRIESRKEKGRRGKKRKCKDKYSNHRTIPILCITLSLPDTARNKKTRTDRMEIERNEKRKENKKRKKNEKEKNPKAITKKEGQGRKKKENKPNKNLDSTTDSKRRDPRKSSCHQHHPRDFPREPRCIGHTLYSWRPILTRSFAACMRG